MGKYTALKQCTLDDGKPVCFALSRPLLAHYQVISRGLPGAPEHSGGRFEITCRLRPSSEDHAADRNNMFDYEAKGSGTVGGGDSFTGTLSSTNGKFSANGDYSGGMAPPLHIAASGNSNVDRYNLSITPKSTNNVVLDYINSKIVSALAPRNSGEYASRLTSFAQSVCDIGGDPQPGVQSNLGTVKPVGTPGARGNIYGDMGLFVMENPMVTRKLPRAPGLHS